MGNIRNLTECINRIQTHHKNSEDIFVSNLNLRCVRAPLGESNSVYLAHQHNGSTAGYQLTEHAQRQLAARNNVPWNGFKWLRDTDTETHFNAFNATIAEHLQENEDKRSLLRTYRVSKDSVLARAVLSPQYFRLDNAVLLKHILPIAEKNGAKLERGDLNADRMSLTFTFPDKGLRIKDKRVISPLVKIDNSEVGTGTSSISGGCFDFYCLNACYRLQCDQWYRQVHKGSNHEYTSVAQIDARANDFARAFETACDSESIGDFVEKLHKTQEFNISGELDKCVEALNHFLPSDRRLTDDEAERVQQEYLAEPDRDLFGLYNAVTKTAQESSNYDRQVTLEETGSIILDWKPRIMELVVAGNTQ